MTTYVLLVFITAILTLCVRDGKKIALAAHKKYQLMSNAHAVAAIGSGSRKNVVTNADVKRLFSNYAVNGHSVMLSDSIFVTDEMNKGIEAIFKAQSLPVWNETDEKMPSFVKVDLHAKLAELANGFNEFIPLIDTASCKQEYTKLSHRLSNLQDDLSWAYLDDEGEMEYFDFIYDIDDDYVRPHRETAEEKVQKEINATIEEMNAIHDRVINMIPQSFRDLVTELVNYANSIEKFDTDWRNTKDYYVQQAKQKAEEDRELKRQNFAYTPTTDSVNELKAAAELARTTGESIVNVTMHDSINDKIAEITAK